jgi:hypothetical protein
MSNQLLVRYIRLIMQEARDARVPQQLLAPEDSEKGSEKDEVENVVEFSGVGAIAGYTAPLGMSPGKKKRTRNK